MARQSVRWAEVESRWQERVEEWKRSGQSQREFCRERGFAVSTFSRWKCELLGGLGRGSCGSVACRPVESASHPGSESGLSFAEVPWSSSQAAELELMLPSGWSIRLGQRFESEALRRLLAVLGSGPC